ncbi:uncharacterized protein LOC111718403 [Eurytemora carolleeae]|uniref:uncharacterized protein LOC111718403 n=1 Tax=Eurytemora carolleeae TaxID=1294199 RepID=UPI000C7625E5|nr:uncharacterized protein LOC111718403 [Eurytemora carolleeae]|eukprot:XP_023349752.1 uncharacterized protein LOC111718403 [Eurytemora affinis]
MFGLNETDSISTIQLVETKNNSDCGSMSEDEAKLAISCSYWLEGVLLTVVGCIGILGNLANIIILNSKSVSNFFNTLLSILSFSDLIFITLTVLDYSLIRGKQSLIRGKQSLIRGKQSLIRGKQSLIEVNNLLSEVNNLLLEVNNLLIEVNNLLSEGTYPLCNNI